MKRTTVACSALLVGLVVPSTANLEGLTRATGGIIALPRIVQRNAPEFQWKGTVERNGAVEIKGVNGDVTAEPPPGAEVEVTAERRGRRNNPEDVQIEVVQHGDGVTICAVYPSRDASRPNECKPGHDGRMNVQNNDVSVTFRCAYRPASASSARRSTATSRRKTLNGPCRSIPSTAPLRSRRRRTARPRPSTDRSAARWVRRAGRMHSNSTPSTAASRWTCRETSAPTSARRRSTARSPPTSRSRSADD